MRDFSLSKFEKYKKDIKFSRFKRRILKHVFLVRCAFLIFVIAAIFGLFFLIKTLTASITGTDYFNITVNFLFPSKNLKISEGRTNILILGKGGNGHDAPDLTDTIIFLSIPNKKSDIVMISVPRDIWLDDLKAKINSAYYWGNQKERGGGIVLAKSEVEMIIGKPIHYAVVLDFSIFKEIVDTLGGIDVNVERSFVDEKYPISGKEDDLCDGDFEYKCRYETITFKEGKQFMDGETALKYVRSRNAEGDEGTDLARSARQGRLIGAIKEKFFTTQVLFDIKKIRELKNLFLENVETDIDSNTGASLFRYAFDSRKKISSHVMPDEFVKVAPKSFYYDNLYVFIPNSGNWEDFQKWVDNTIKN